MRFIRGLDEAKETLHRDRGLGLERVPPAIQARILEVFGQAFTPVQVVEHIIQEVQARGDASLRELAHRLDGVELESLEVPPDEMAAAYRKVPKELVEALTVGAHRIRTFHEASRAKSWVDFEKGYGELVTPLGRVGVYVPGGTAPYPSTVLMTAIPARVAGVEEVILVSPAREGNAPSPAMLVAADIAGVDRVFHVGGAQAIAAMAFGTQTIPRVDLICGPGNIFVTLAKKLLVGQVGIDGLYGPTETLIIADETANPSLCAADLLAQAEHDVLASPILVTTSEGLARDVEREVERQLAGLERAEIARASLAEQGCLVLVDSLEEAIDLSNHYAPEHLCLMVRKPWEHLGQVRNAGGVFLGEFSPEVMGDYVAGPSHAMPTGGTARFSSPVGVHTFLKVSSVVALDKGAFAGLSRAASIIGRAEGFTGHAKAAEARERLLEEQ